jgi:hypothetical protein
MIKNWNTLLSFSLCAMVSSLVARSVFQANVEKRLALQSKIITDIKVTRDHIKSQPKFGQMMLQARMDVLLDNL